jgi:hypothetical protein
MIQIVREVIEYLEVIKKLLIDIHEIIPASTGPFAQRAIHVMHEPKES